MLEERRELKFYRKKPITEKISFFVTARTILDKAEIKNNSIIRAAWTMLHAAQLIIL